MWKSMLVVNFAIVLISHYLSRIGIYYIHFFIFSFINNFRMDFVLCNFCQATRKVPNVPHHSPGIFIFWLLLSYYYYIFYLYSFSTGSQSKEETYCGLTDTRLLEEVFIYLFIFLKNNNFSILCIFVLNFFLRWVAWQI